MKNFPVSSKKIKKKSYNINIESKGGVDLSPHILNLRELDFKENEGVKIEIQEKNILSSRAECGEVEGSLKDDRSLSDFSAPLPTVSGRLPAGRQEMTKELPKRNNWRYFKIKMRLFLVSIFNPKLLESSSLKPKSSVQELFVVQIISTTFLITWRVIKFSCWTIWFFLNSFISLFRKDEVEDEPLPQNERINKLRDKLIPRQLKMREAVVVFVIVAFAIIMPLRLFLTYEGLNEIKQSILGAGEAALGHMSLAFEDTSVEGREEVLEKVEGELNFAAGEIGEINFLIRNLISILPEKGEQFQSGKALLSAGSELTYAASLLNERFGQIENTENLSEKFNFINAGIEEATPYIESANGFLGEVEEDALPEEAKDGVKKLKKMVSGILVGINDFKKTSDIILNILGINEPRRYLLIFQNNNEIRATGGFIGSFAEVYVRDGKIEKTYFPGGGSYDLDGGLRVRLVPPEPLQLISGRWQFRDANWFPDFPTSAEKISWFYEKSGGGTVDGVITINASFVENLLAFLGPIEMAEYGKALTADNFIDEVQYAVEVEYDKEENKPKQILADMMPILIDRLMEKTNEDLFKLGDVFTQGLKTRDLQFYFNNEDLQNKIVDFGWGGEIKQTAGDYLAIFNSNIAGQKTDKVIDEKIEHTTLVDENGNIVNVVKVTRTHNGVKGDLFTGVRNVNYARVYVPQGSVLLQVTGFNVPEAHYFDTIEDGCVLDEDVAESQKLVMVDPQSGTRVTEEFGKTVFGNWTIVDPGESTTYAVAYQLPFKLDFKEPGFFEKLFNEESAPLASYNLFIQKQSGSTKTNFTHILNLSENMTETWNYNEGDNMDIVKLNQDLFYGTLIKK